MALDLRDGLGRVLLADGDYRLELTERGWPENALLERANLDRPQAVRDVADAYLDGGADIVIANTRSANAAILNERLESGELTEADLAAMNRAGVDIARAAVSDAGIGPRVFGAIGPTPHLLLLEEIDEDILVEAYRTHAKALSDAGVDGIVCVAFRELEALRLAVRAATEATLLPVAAEMAFAWGPEGRETTLGATIPQACEVLVEAGAAVIGFDAGDNPDDAAAVLGLVKSLTNRPLWVRVAAGQPLLQEDRVAYPESPEQYGGRYSGLVEAGASIIAGGRGVSSRHIAAMAAARSRPVKKKRN